MSQIDYTYFIREINIQLNSFSATDPVYAALVNAISRYEDEVLKKALGYALWKEYTDAYAASIATPPTALAQKWSDLKNGAEFSFDYYGHTITEKWVGFTNSDKISLIANYVYYQHRMNIETSNTGIGERKAKGENSVAADAKPKLVKAWNGMVKLYGETPREYIYKDYFLDNANYEHFDTEPSLYNFLLANLSDYSNWVFTPLKLKHSMW